MTCSDTITERYVYTPLQHGDSIRLLHIDPGFDDDPLSLRLFEHRLSDVDEKFEALSYAWCDASDRTPVLLHDFHQLNITTSLHSALWQIRQSAKYQVLWADAVCINQDDLDERSKQVQIMVDIYKAAKSVLIWLGPEDDESARALKWLRKSMSSIEGLATPSLELQTSYVDRKAIEYTFSRRAWWRRKWTLQESVFPRSAHILCRNWSFAWVDLVMFVYNYCGKFHWKKLSSREKLKSEATKLALEEVLKTTDSTYCTDPRDFVYGVIGLCHFPTRKVISDYTKTKAEVFLDAAIVMLADAQSLWPICTWQPLPKESSSMPSWVPDFDYLFVIAEKLNYHIYSATKSRSVGDAFLDEGEQGVLKLSGVLYGTVDATAGSLHQVRDADYIWRDTTSKDERIVPDFYLRALLADQDPSAGADGRWKRMCKEKLEEFRQVYEGRLEESTQAFIHRIAYLNIWYRFCRTKSGHFGWVPKSFEEGDLIYLVYGSNLPFLLRPWKGAAIGTHESPTPGPHIEKRPIYKLSS